MADHVEGAATGGRRGAGGVRLVAVVELRRSMRRLLDDPAALVALVVLAIGSAGTAAGMTALVLLPPGLFGRVLAVTEVGGGRMRLARAGTAAAWVGLTGGIVSRTASVTGRLDAPDAVLLALSPRQAAFGVVGAEWFRVAGVLGPAVLLSGATAARVGDTTAGASVALAGGLLVGSAVAAGYPGGLLLTAVVEGARRRGVGWIRLAGLGAVVVVVVGASGTVVGLPPVEPFAVAAVLPPGGLADLAFGPVATQVGGVVPGRAAGGVAWAAGLVVVGPTLAGALAQRLWLVDPPRSAATEHPGGLGRIPAPPGSLAVRAVVRAVWLRAARAPVKLVYTLYPIGGVIALWLDPGARARIVASLYVYVPLYAAWAGGAGLALNPLGDEGAGLPVVLTAAQGRSFVRGHLLAAGIPGAVIGGTVSVGAVVVADLAASAAVVGVVVSVALAALSAAVAVGVGTALPSFERVRIGASTRVVVPSFAASVVFFVALAVVSTPGTLALLAVADLPTLLPDSGTAVGGAVALQVTVAALAVVIAQRRAAGRFDRYTIA